MSQIQQVKEANDIVGVIGERVDLQRSGSQFRGLCPFHSEKSPSFFVSDQMQRFKCFGCGEAGDVITFLEKYEGMSFVEALEYLADKAGIELEKKEYNKDDQLQKDVLAVLALAAEYYHFLLTKHESGKPGKEYLADRKVSSESVELFKLGYSLDSWDGLLNYLHKKKKWKLHVLEQAGLIIKGRSGKYYDRFRGRLIFPLRDHRGRVVGFSGRVLDPTEKQAKYINTPETIVYHKSKMLYGYHELYHHIRKAEEVVVTEGEVDVISASQAHLNTVVAIKGSALTVDHARLLSRTVKRVILALDSDSAGVKATKRAIQILRDFPIELRVYPIESGKDIDELAKADPKQLRKISKLSLTAYEFLIDRAMASHDITSPAGKRQVMIELSPELNAVPHVVELEHYIGLLAEKLGVQKSVVRADLERGKALKPLKQPTEAEEAAAQPQLTRRQRLERYVLFLLLKDELQLLQRVQELDEVHLSDEFVQHIYQVIRDHKTETMKALSAQLPEDMRDAVVELLSSSDWNTNQQDSSDWQQAVAELRLAILKDQQQEIKAELTQLDAVEDKSDQQEEQSLKLVQQLTTINKQLATLTKK